MISFGGVLNFCELTRLNPIQTRLFSSSGTSKEVSFEVGNMC